MQSQKKDQSNNSTHKYSQLNSNIRAMLIIAYKVSTISLQNIDSMNFNMSNFS